jgi:hypothetical protein
MEEPIQGVKKALDAQQMHIPAKPRDTTGINSFPG